MKKFLLSTLMLGAVTLTLSAQNGTKDAPYSVDEFLALGIPDTAVADTYVEGYIVGYVDGAKLTEGARFDLSAITASNNTNLLLASSSSETNVALCIPVALPSGTIRNELNLAAHPENLGHGVVLCGSREKYFGSLGLKNLTAYEWIGEAPEPTEVTPPSVAETGTKENPLTVTEFQKLGIPANAVANSWLTGVIVGSVETVDSNNVYVMGATASSSATNILIAATANPASDEECVPIQLPKGDIRSALNLLDNPGNVGKTIVLCGSRESYFSVVGLKSPTEYSLSGEGTEPTPDPGLFYSGVATNANADGWTLDEGTLPEGLNYVWSYDAKYGLKAQAYYDGNRYATDIYAVSPVIDLANAKTAELTLQQALNYDNGDTTIVSIEVREENGAWNKLTVDGWPAGMSWTFVDSRADLADYVGKKIQIGLRYTSTATVAATWEVKNVKVAGEANDTAVEAIVADAPVYVAGNDIVAPAGARVFNLQGVETGANSLPAGIYVVVLAEKAVKVAVK